MLTPLFFFVLRRTVITLEKLSRRVLTTTSKATVNQELKEIKIKKSLKYDLVLNWLGW